MTHSAAHPPVAGTRPVPADHPMFLWDERQCWRVTAGHLDLFAVPVGDGKASGRHTFLGRLGVGQVVLPMPLAAGMGILARGGTESVVAAVEMAAELLPADDINGWVAILCQAIGDEFRTGRLGIQDGIHELAAGETVNGRGRDPLWTTLGTGRASLLDGLAEIIPGMPAVPLTPAMVLTAAEPARITLRRTAEIQQEGGLGPALAAFHLLAMEGTARLTQRRQDELAQVVTDRMQQSQLMLENSLNSLAAAIEPGRPAAPTASGGDPVMAVVRRVAAEIGLSAQAPAPGVPYPGPHGDVGRILRASRLRSRVVLLRDKWWRGGELPLVAHRQESGEAVALLPRKGGYVLWRPDGGEFPVTEAVAAGLEAQALAVYPRFGSNQLDRRQVAALAIHGSKGDVLTFLALALGGALLALLTPMAASLLVDEIIPTAARGDLGILVAGLAVAAFATTAFELTKALALLRFEGRLDAALQAALFDRLLRLPAAFFKNYTAGDLTDRVLGVQAIRQMLTGATVTSLLGGIFSTVSLVMLFHYSVPLAGLAVALAAISCAVTGVLVWLQLRHERRLALLRGGVEGLVLQMITGVGKIAVAAARERAMAHWTGKYTAQKRHAMAVQRVARMQAVFMAAFPPLTTVAIFLGMAMLAKSAMAEAQLKALAGGEETQIMGAGAFLAFNAALAQFLTGMTHAVRSLGGVLGAVPLWERAKPLLHQPPEDGGKRHSPGTLNGDVEFSGVGFSYHADGPSVLKGFSTTIRAGEFVALVGPSGGGKSTIMRLLLGLEQPTEGEIFFDGKPLSRLDFGHVRAQIGVVLQNSRVLPGDIFHNIVGNNSDCRLEDAWEAAAMVGLDADIRAMPMGMHTVLMEGGATLSGGQRQRLAIARALVRRPRILLLDEATSALDNRTQAIVTESLARLGITRILIAHRLSTITGVDRILVVDQGRLVQAGSHAELVAQPGLFADMAKRQLL
ncbi:MAG: NHLP bacteriocin export ABC transporter permease/ATPase subunit [Bacteroidales bacterium]